MSKIQFSSSVQGAAGLRGAPVADLAALTALPALNFEKRKVLDTQKVYIFNVGKTPVNTDVADDEGTGAWELVINEARAILNYGVANQSGASSRNSLGTDNVPGVSLLIPDGRHRITVDGNASFNGFRMAYGAILLKVVNSDSGEVLAEKTLRVKTVQDSGGGNPGGSLDFSMFADVVLASPATIILTRQVTQIGSGNSGTSVILDNCSIRSDEKPLGSIIPPNQTNHAVTDALPDSMKIIGADGKKWANHFAVIGDAALNKKTDQTVYIAEKTWLFTQKRSSRSSSWSDELHTPR